MAAMAQDLRDAGHVDAADADQVDALRDRADERVVHDRPHFGELEQDAGDAARRVGPRQAMGRLSHVAQALLVVQQLADERQHLVEVFVVEDCGGTVALEVAGVDALVAARVGVGDEDGGQADRRKLAEHGGAGAADGEVGGGHRPGCVFVQVAEEVIARPELLRQSVADLRRARARRTGR